MIKDYSHSIKLISEGWDDSVTKFKSGIKVWDQYSLNHYCYMVWMLSLGILLNATKEERTVLKTLITNGRIQDEFILFLLESLTKEKIEGERNKTTYKPFKNLLKNTDCVNIKENDVKKYLASWYKNTKLLTWHNYRASIGDSYYYYGYWSFEAAAVVATLDLDDSRFRDNEYYPKDLVDFYRTQKGKGMQ